ncbi:unnamed protein product [Phytomonas sp. EM1]|nr:unnamed protein product [Phytomonas sp. EM1]|eukprot:CCW63071.1 unnamed protein product [Phytomonas sp. isolate EM1]
MESTGEPSFSVATLVGKAIAVGFGSKLVVGLYPMSSVGESGPNSSLTIDDKQLIRAVTFVQFPEGPLCVVTAGDAKYINVYNLDSMVHCNPATLRKTITDSHSEVNDAGLQLSESKPIIQEIEPCYHYGPHTKRITSMITEVDGCIIFADKFGEVYRLQLNWNPSSKTVTAVSDDQKPPAAFLFQHFSIILALYLSSPIPPFGASSGKPEGHSRRRLFSCDKDHHCRVSFYPAVYNIEQFLWPTSKRPAVTTCVEEIPLLDRKRVCASAASTPHPNGTIEEARPLSHYVTGSYEGEVFLWVARNDLPPNSSEESFRLVSRCRPESGEVDTPETGAVLSMVYLACRRVAECSSGPLCDSPSGVLVAYEKLKAVVFFQISSTKEDGLEAHHSLVYGGRIQLEQFPTAMVRCDESTVLILNRDGATARVHLSATHGSDPHSSHIVGDKGEVSPEPYKPGANTNFRLSFLPHVTTSLEEGIKHIITPRGINLLSELNLFSQWQKTVSDPRTRQKQLGSDESGDDINMGASRESNKISHESKDEHILNKRARPDSNE